MTEPTLKITMADSNSKPVLEITLSDGKTMTVQELVTAHSEQAEKLMLAEQELQSVKEMHQKSVGALQQDMQAAHNTHTETLGSLSRAETRSAQLTEHLSRLVTAAQGHKCKDVKVCDLDSAVNQAKGLLPK